MISALQVPAYLSASSRNVSRDGLEFRIGERRCAGVVIASFAFRVRPRQNPPVRFAARERFYRELTVDPSS